jgi:gluconolactonase
MDTPKIRYDLIWTAVGLLGASPLYAHPPLSYPTLGKIERHDPAFDKLIPKDAVIEVLASGFDWSEGPVWVKDELYATAATIPAVGPAGTATGVVSAPPEDQAESTGGYLLFSDIPRNSVMRWREGEGVSLFMRPSGYTGVTPYGNEPGCNGLTLDSKGRLTFCEHGDRRVSRLEKEGGKRTLVDNYQGKRLNSPNDLTYHSNGDLYFTDPPYGLPEHMDDPRCELDFCGVYRLGTDGKLTLLTKELSRPNGIGFSPDEKTLYVSVSDPEKAIWMAFDVKADGTLGKGRLLFDATPWVDEGQRGLPDGMDIDAGGNVYASGPGGVHVFTPAGKLLGSFAVAEACSNCAWGDDGSTLYITVDSYLCRVRTSTKGARWK